MKIEFDINGVTGIVLPSEYAANHFPADKEFVLTSCAEYYLNELDHGEVLDEYTVSATLSDGTHIKGVVHTKIHATAALVE